MRGRKTGGRRAGTPNKATAELREAAQGYTAAALAELARLATDAISEAVRVTACRELLDRGHGRSSQALSLADNEGNQIIVEIRR
jgi:hypothetical protein